MNHNTTCLASILKPFASKLLRITFSYSSKLTTPSELESVIYIHTLTSSSVTSTFFIPIYA